MQTSRLRHHHPSLQNIQTLLPTSPHAQSPCFWKLLTRRAGGLLWAILGRVPLGAGVTLPPCCVPTGRSLPLSGPQPSPCEEGVGGSGDTEGPASSDRLGWTHRAPCAWRGCWTEVWGRSPDPPAEGRPRRLLPAGEAGFLLGAQRGSRQHRLPAPKCPVPFGSGSPGAAARAVPRPGLARKGAGVPGGGLPGLPGSVTLSGPTAPRGRSGPAGNCADRLDG